MQFQQCVVQQVKPEILVPAAEDKKKKKAAVGEGAATLLQLPGVDVDVARALDKNARIRSLQVRPPSSAGARAVPYIICTLAPGPAMHSGRASSPSRTRWVVCTRLHCDAAFTVTRSQVDARLVVSCGISASSKAWCAIAPQAAGVAVAYDMSSECAV